MIKVIAFDLDDTLWRVDPVIIRAEKRLAAWFDSHSAGLKYDSAAMRELRRTVVMEDPGVSHKLTELRRRVIERLMLAQGVQRQQAAIIAEDAMVVFLEARNDVEFFEGVMDTISEMSSNFRLGALTNGNADIHQLGLANHFSFSFSAEEVGAPKPAPDLFHTALSHTGVLPHEMVYVGDDPVKDVDTANGVGLHSIWVRNNARPGPGETEPDITIDDIRELPDAVNQLTQG